MAALRLSLTQLQARCGAAGVAPPVGFAELSKGEACASYAVRLADGAQAVLKLFWRSIDAAPLRREAAVLEAVRRAGTIPVPAWSHLDDSSELLGYPSLLLAWLPGADADDVFDRAGPAEAQQLLRQCGRLLRALHETDQAVAVQAGLDPNGWPAFEQAEFAAAVARLRQQRWLDTGVLDQAEWLWAATAAAREPAAPAVLLHGDFQLWNIRVDPERLEPTGLVDFGNAAIGPAVCDFRDLELNLFLEYPRLREAFRAGYGQAALGPAAELHLGLTTLSRALSLLAAYQGAAPMVPTSTPRALLERLERPLAAWREAGRHSPAGA